MVDGVTSDEDKVAPVYKLEEICDLLRTSPAGIVKEVSDYTFKRMDHKSPIVKQKTLRLIKFAVGKSGVDFRREMQRNSATIRELVHYKGQPDQLKGDALNKAVRDTAREVVSAIFSTDENKTSPAESIGNRIQGFGSTNFDMPVEDKKSFISEVIDLGRASIEQGLSSIAAAHTMRKSDGPGNYRSPNLRRSLTTEADTKSTYQGPGKIWASSESSNDAASRTWGNDSTQNIDPSSADRGVTLTRAEGKSREEKLLDTIVTTGGVRLQPTRDTIQIFLFEAAKLDQISMCHAIELKLQSNLWQVRMKALCILESLLRKKDEEFALVASYFSDNKGCVVKCSESPQVSLREKASKVLGLIGGTDTSARRTPLAEPSSTKDIPIATPLPDLIDTGDPDDYNGSNSHEQSKQSSNEVTPPSLLADDLFGTKPLTSGTEGNATSKHNPSGGTNLPSAGSLVDDLFGAQPVSDPHGGRDTEGDPFADVSFHVDEGKKPLDDGLFSGLTVDGLISADNLNNSSMPGLFDVFDSKAGLIVPDNTNQKKMDTHNLMAGLSIHDVSQGRPVLASSALFTGPPTSSNLDNPLNLNSSSTNVFGGVLNSNMAGASPNTFFPMGSVQYNVSPSLGYHPALTSQQVNFGQQQFAFANTNGTNLNVYTNFNNESNLSELPDIFRPSAVPVQSHIPSTSSTKIDDTKAFSFISDHITAARDSKKKSFKL